MTQRNSSSNSSSSDSLHAFADVHLCIICEQAALGVGPFSRHHLCQGHLDIDVQQANDLHRFVNEKLQAYSEGDTNAVFAREQLELERQLQEMERRFAELQQRLNKHWIGLREKLTARIDAVKKCVRDLDDVKSYDREVKEALSLGKMAEVVDLAVGMEASLPDLAEDFSVCERVRNDFEIGGLMHQLEKLEQMMQRVVGGADATDAGVTARPETRDTGVAMDQVLMNHELKLDGPVYQVGVCNETSEFQGDRSGRVVPKDGSFFLRKGDGRMALPKPCLVAWIRGKDHLTVLSLDGTVRLQSRCTEVDWKVDLHGLHCDRQLVFIAQSSAVTVIDLSGRTIRRILPDSASFGSIRGIGGNAASVFVSSGNKIAAFNKSNWRLEKIITVSQLPNADLGNLVIHQNSIFIIDWKHNQVHIMSIDTQQLVASHPTHRSDLERYKMSIDVAVDSRGCMFVTELLGHSVRSVTADDRSLMWTLFEPYSESGNGSGKLKYPCGLTVLKGGPCEQLVVADSGNHRLLVLNLW